MKENVVCVFCENIYEAGTTICPECNEYDGMMPINLETDDYLKEND